MEQFKWETAREVGIQIPADGYLGDIPSRQNGAIGGHMVRRMIALAEQQLAGGGAAVTGLAAGTVGGGAAGGGAAGGGFAGGGGAAGGGLAGGTARTR